MLKAESRRESEPPIRSGELVFGEDTEAGTIIAFNHLPNTAAGSMRELVRRVMSKQGERTQVGPFDPLTSFTVRQLWNRTLRRYDDDALQRVCYAAGPHVGHVIARLRRPAEIYTLLRDPVELIASAARRVGVDLNAIFMEELTQPDWCNPQARAILAGFADVDELAASRGPGADADSWRARLAAVAGEYYRFGTRERFLDSARLFSATLPFTRLLMPTVNVSHEVDVPALSDELVDAIAAANWLDIELYEQYGRLPPEDVARRAARARSANVDGHIGTPPGSFTGRPGSPPSQLANDPETQLAWLRLRVMELERRAEHAPAKAEGARRAEPSAAAGTDHSEPQTEPDSKDNKVIRGKNGWLYLAHDSNRVLDQITAQRRFTEEELDQWQAAIRERRAIAREAGAAYAIIVPPNQHSAYPEHLPAGIELSEQRPVMQLVDRLRGDAEAPFLYPIEALTRAREERPTYGPTNSHWNDWGAFVGYQELCGALEAQGVMLHRLTADDVEWDEFEDRGDLGLKVHPAETATQPRARVVSSSSRLVFDNRIRNRGRELVYERDDAPSRALVFGDSFGYVAIKFLSETFGRLVYAHLSQIFDRTLLEREQPDAVVTIINERFLVQLPKTDAPTLAEIVDVKARRGYRMSEHDARRQKMRTLRSHVPDE